MSRTPGQAPGQMFPVFGVRQVDTPEANALLVEWAHPLGPCDRPFGVQSWALEVDGVPIAVAVSASTVSATVEEWRRAEVVELARIARHPEHRGALRVALRVWRDYLARRWPFWPVVAAVSYALPGTPGNLYRFDGWENRGRRDRSGGGGSWTSSAPKVNDVDDGVKTLWAYRFEGGN